MPAVAWIDLQQARIQPFATLSPMALADHSELLDYLEAWSRARIGKRSAVEFARTGDDRPKPAAWINGDDDGRLAELIVWSTGEAELVMGSDGEATVNEHHELSNIEELDSVLDRLSAWLAGENR